MPGDNVSCEVSLITPVALEKGLRSRFAKAATRWEQARYGHHRVTVNRESGREIKQCGNDYVAVRGLQEPQLHDDEE